MRTPIFTGTLQSDLDFAGHSPVNLPGWPPTGGGGLDANTVTADDIGLVGDGVTDNTAAFQAWLNAAGAAAVNTTLLVPDGIYIFSGALQDTSGKNAQIIIPAVTAAPWFTITIKGYHTLSPAPAPPGFGTVPICTGATFKSTLTTGGGTQPSFITGTTGHLRLENMIFQTVPNPLISCLNFRAMSWIELTGEVIIIAGGTTDALSVTEPTTTTSYGLLLPDFNNGVLEPLESVHIFGFYTGCRMAELTLVQALGVYFCHYAIEFPFAYHSTLIERLMDFWCQNGINVTNSNYFVIQHHDIEVAHTGWQTRVYDVNDPSNYGIGNITWWQVLGGTGVINSYVVNGGTGIKTKRIGV
jgi:hypothetical protein